MTLGIRDKHRGAALHVLLLECRHVLSIRAWAGRLTLIVVLRRALLLAVERFLVAQRLQFNEQGGNILMTISDSE